MYTKDHLTALEVFIVLIVAATQCKSFYCHWTDCTKTFCQLNPLSELFIDMYTCGS